MKPSQSALHAARKRARAKGRANTPLNIMDVLKAIDIIAKRLDLLEKEVYAKRDY